MLEGMAKNPICSLRGKVIHGKGIGKLIGMPTADIQVDDFKKLPSTGVYSSIVVLENKKYISVTNIGKRPTIDNDDTISVETHILDFFDDIYYKTIELQLFHKLRIQKKFDTLSELRDQFYLDCQNTKYYFNMSFFKNKENTETEDTIHIGELDIDVKKRTVFLCGEQIMLTTKEFDVLHLLVEHPGWAYSKNQIYERVWNEPANGYYHPVENTICQLRKKLQPVSGNAMFIKTIVGFGYKFSEI